MVPGGVGSAGGRGRRYQPDCLFAFQRARACLAFMSLDLSLPTWLDRWPHWSSAYFPSQELKTRPALGEAGWYVPRLWPGGPNRW